MNKALLLLLVTLLQSQSDGFLLPSPNDSDKFDENLEDMQLEDWENPESLYSSDVGKEYTPKTQLYKKRSVSDVLTRRSTLDKNFMRFGRSSGETDHHNKFFGVGRSSFTENKPNYFRFGRRAKDNFLRFGRGAKDDFIRFGRTGTEDFFQTGKRGRDSFIPLGKADKNFIRFGRNQADNDNKLENLDNQDYFSHLGVTTGKFDEIPVSFERINKSPGKLDSFIRFGKSGNQKEGRNGTNFLRFGKRNPAESSEALYTDDTDLDVINQDLSPETIKYGPIMRIKRKTTGTDDKEASNLANDTGNSKHSTGDNSNKAKSGNAKINKRSTSFFEQLPENFPRRITPVFVGNSWQNLDTFRNSRLSPPFFPGASKFPNYLTSPTLYLMTSNLESKRDKGTNRNFIRFG